jgi:hypothetical protein
MCGKWDDICCCCGRAVALLPLLLLVLVGSALYVRTTAYFLVKVPVRLYHVVVRKEIAVICSVLYHASLLLYLLCVRINICVQLKLMALQLPVAGNKLASCWQVSVPCVLYVLAARVW